MVIADLPARKAKRKNAGNATPTPKWAPDRSSYTGFLANSGTFTVQGKKSGSATVTMQGNAFGGSWSVQYTDYSDDGDSFLNGTESTSQGSILSGITWNAALTLSGKHSGHLNADLVFARGENNSGAQVSGTVSQRLDKRTVSTLPSPTCEPLARPRLRVKASSPRKGNRVRVLVTGKVPVDSAWRPVRHATVRVGGRSATTNQKGTVSMKGGAGRKVSAAAAGFTGAKARVPRPARR